MNLLSIGDSVGDRYTVEAEVGRGGMQEVYQAYDDTLNRKVALKVPQDARVARKFRETAIISARVNHPNVAKTLDYFEDDDGKFYLVEELVNGDNLRDIANKFQRLDPHTSVCVLHHLARGVSASHRVGVVHRDLKPSNIMIAGGLNFNGIKITDFGIAKMAEHEITEAVLGGEESTRSSRTVMNALAYIAPEVIDAPRSASMPADVWAIAAIAWELLTGFPPFGTGLKAIKAIGLGKKPELPAAVRSHRQFGGLAKELHEIVMKCFEIDPSKRPTANDVAALCDSICYHRPARELGVVSNYPAHTLGFIAADSGDVVFFHTQNVVGERPQVGARVWFTRFYGAPRPRAIPVIPLK